MATVEERVRQVTARVLKVDPKEIKLEDMTEGFELAVDMAKENAQ